MVHIIYTNLIPTRLQIYVAENLSHTQSISLTKYLPNDSYMVTLLHIYFKLDKKARLSTPSAYWAKRGFCKLPKGSWFFPTTH